MRAGKTAILGLLLAAAPSISGMAQEAAPFYRGKTIRIVISAGVAGGYAEYARLLADHMAPISRAGRISSFRAVIKSTRPQWLTEHKISVPILIAEKRSAEFPDTPTIMEFVKDQSTRQQLERLMVSQSLDRPVMLPPGVPAGRVEELRQAFDATMADEAFRRDVERKNLHVDPVRGEDMASALGRAFSLPAEVIAGAREMMGER